MGNNFLFTLRVCFTLYNNISKIFHTVESIYKIFKFENIHEFAKKSKAFQGTFSGSKGTV